MEDRFIAARRAQLLAANLSPAQYHLLVQAHLAGADHTLFRLMTKGDQMTATALARLALLDAVPGLPSAYLITPLGVLVVGARVLDHWHR